MAAGAALPGLFFCFAAMVLLVFVCLNILLCFLHFPNSTYLLSQASVSAPTWNKIYFLDASNGSQDFHFGVFGYTGTGTSIGYYFDPSTLGFRYLNHLLPWAFMILTFYLQRLASQRWNHS